MVIDAISTRIEKTKLLLGIQTGLEAAISIGNNRIIRLAFLNRSHQPIPPHFQVLTHCYLEMDHMYIDNTRYRFKQLYFITLKETVSL